MRPTLVTEVEEFLRWNGPQTATQIATGVRARRDDVDDVLAGEIFRRVPPPVGCNPRATYFSLSYLVPARPARVVNRGDKMLKVLRDGRWHSRQEIFEAEGFFLTNNAASELRSRGYKIEQRRERGVYIYRLVGALDEAASSPSAVSRESA